MTNYAGIQSYYCYHLKGLHQKTYKTSQGTALMRIWYCPVTACKHFGFHLQLLSPLQVNELISQYKKEKLAVQPART